MGGARQQNQTPCPQPCHTQHMILPHSTPPAKPHVRAPAETKAAFPSALKTIVRCTLPGLGQCVGAHCRPTGRARTSPISHNQVWSMVHTAVPRFPQTPPPTHIDTTGVHTQYVCLHRSWIVSMRGWGKRAWWGPLLQIPVFELTCNTAHYHMACRQRARTGHPGLEPQPQRTAAGPYRLWRERCRGAWRASRRGGTRGTMPGSVQQASPFLRFWLLSKDYS